MPGSWSARLVRLPLVVCLALAVTAASAEGQDGGSAEGRRDDEMARTLFETGRAYFERAQYDEAAAAFAKAYRLSGRHRLLVNQARALDSSGRVEEAIEALERFLEAAPEDEPVRGTVQPMLRRLRAAAARRAEGGDGDAPTREPADEEGASEPPQPDGREAGAPGGESAAGGAQVGRTATWWAGIGALSLAGAAAVVAVGTGVASHRTHGSLEEDCPTDVCPPELEGDIRRGRKLGVASTVLTFVGVGAAATGALLLMLGRHGGEEAPESKVQATGGPGQVGAGLRVTF
ncbi:MAG: tetratricopeptide repeat protein [Myxococcota bacterium]